MTHQTLFPQETIKPDPATTVSAHETEAAIPFSKATTPEASGVETNTSAKSRRRPIRIWVDGCFDLTHHGHFNALRQAKAMGDYLVAGVHSDAEIELHKGPTVMKEDERYAAVAACKWVDEVVPNAPFLTSLEWMDRYDCDFCVHGDDISTLADGTDCYQHVKDAGRYRECKRTQDVSTTELVGRMLLMTRDHHFKYARPQQHSSQRPTMLTLASGSSFEQPNSSSSINTVSSMTSVGSMNSISSISSVNTTALESFSTRVSPAMADTKISHFLPTSRKIVQFSEGREPRDGEKVVYVDGTFDLFHPGHIEFLRRAKEEGDYLLVGIHDDGTVNAIKGGNHPLMNLHERVLSVLACRYVDEVVLGAPYSLTDQVLDKVYPIDLVLHGNTTSMKDTDGQDPYRLAKERGIYREIQNPNNTVTTESILTRIITHRKTYEDRQRRKEQKARKEKEAEIAEKAEKARKALFAMSCGSDVKEE